MSDFRDRFGEQLAAAAAALVAAPQADFRERFGVQLALAAGELAAAHRRERLAAPPSRSLSRLRVRTWLPRPPQRRLAPVLVFADFRGRFGAQLSAAAAELAAARRPLAVARRRRLPWLTRPVAVGLALTAFAGSAFAAVAIWTPLLGNPRYGYNPGVSTTAPPADQLAALAVLRRPQTDADRGALSAAALTYINDYTTGVRTEYVRLLATVGTEAFVLVPVAERRSSASTGGAPSESAPLANALCLYISDTSPMLADVACWSLAQVTGGRAWGLLDGQFYGLAPDGLTGVTVTAVGTPTASAPITNNLFVLTLSPSGAPIGTPSVRFTSG